MITEDYCSFELSKLLKEKGFDAPDLHGLDSSHGHLWVKVTHQMAMKWLREIHKISIDICTVQGKRVSYMFNIWDFANIYDNKYIGGTFDLREQLYNFNTYEGAVEAAIKYSLENLI